MEVVFAFTSVIIVCGGACCVTDIILDKSPLETVITPVLGAVPVLAVTLTVIIPLFEPLAGVTVNHDVASLRVVHATLDLTSISIFCAVCVGFHLSASTSSIGDCCVISIVLVNPPPVTMILPVRDEVPVLAVTPTVSVASFEPLAGATESHTALLLAVQSTLDAIATGIFCATGDRLANDDAGVTIKDGAACVTVTVLVTPPPGTEIVALLSESPGLAVTLIVIVPLPEPLVGDKVSHVASLLAVQDTPDVTVRTAVCALGDKGNGGGVTMCGSGVRFTLIVKVVGTPLRVTVTL